MEVCTQKYGDKWLIQMEILQFLFPFVPPFLGGEAERQEKGEL